MDQGVRQGAQTRRDEGGRQRQSLTQQRGGVGAIRVWLGEVGLQCQGRPTRGRQSPGLRVPLQVQRAAREVVQEHHGEVEEAEDHDEAASLLQRSARQILHPARGSLRRVGHRRAHHS